MIRRPDSNEIEQQHRLFNVFVSPILKEYTEKLKDGEIILAITSVPRGNSYTFTLTRKKFIEEMHTSFYSEFGNEISIPHEHIEILVRNALTSFDNALMSNPNQQQVCVAHVMIFPENTDVFIGSYTIPSERALQGELLLDKAPEKAWPNPLFTDEILAQRFSKMTGLPKLFEHFAGVVGCVIDDGKTITLIPVHNLEIRNHLMYLFDVHLLGRDKRNSIQQRLDEYNNTKGGLIVYIISQYKVFYPIFIEYEHNSNKWKSVSC